MDLHKWRSLSALAKQCKRYDDSLTVMWFRLKAYLNHFLLCVFMSKVTYTVLGEMQAKSGGIQSRWPSYWRISDWCPLCYYLMKEAAVWCLVCCVGCPCSVLWVEMELLSFRKECQHANLLGFEVTEDLWGVSAPAWWWHLMRLGIACLYQSWGLGLACLHTTSMT